MGLENDLDLIELGLVTYEELRVFQNRLIDLKKKGALKSDALLCAQVYPVMDFGSVASQNKFSESSLSLIKSKIKLDSYEVDSKLINLVNDSGLFDLPITLSERGGGSTIFRPGQYLYFPVVDVSKMFPGQVPLACAYLMMDVARNFIEKDKLRVSSSPITAKVLSSNMEGVLETPEDEFDLAYLSDSGLLKLGSKGLKVKHMSSDANVKRLLSGGFSFHVEKDSTEGFDLIDPCGIPLSRMGVTTFEDILGSRPNRAEFNVAVYNAMRKYFYNQ